jgi:alkylated DNA repair protein (DNA oxidative demethylase)
MYTSDLFPQPAVPVSHAPERLGEDALVLRAFVTDPQSMLDCIEAMAAISPWRHMQTPGGYEMSVAMTNCGCYGWVSDRKGYRYAMEDPLTGRSWPAMPASFLTLAHDAAQVAGFSNFVPDACLINRYAQGAKMGLHQDKDEEDMRQPIVSVSLGLPAIFLFGGLKRSDKTQRVLLQHGDVVVWGGEDRLRYHGILPLKAGMHAATGEYRFNLTFRKAVEA